MIAPVQKSHERTWRVAESETTLRRFVFRWKCFAGGVGPMLYGGGGEWLNWRRYVYALRVEGPDFTAFQFRLLWFYVGLRFKNYELIRLREVLDASHLHEIECAACERPLIAPIEVESTDVICGECHDRVQSVVNASQQ
jgi:hypothetical protein